MATADAVTVGILHAIAIMSLIFLAGWTPYFIWCIVDTHRFQRIAKRCADERAASDAAAKIQRDEEIRVRAEISRRIEEQKSFGKCTVCNDWHYDLSDPCDGHRYPTGAVRQVSLGGWTPQEQTEESKKAGQ